MQSRMFVYDASKKTSYLIPDLIMFFIQQRQGIILSYGQKGKYMPSDAITSQMKNVIHLVSETMYIPSRVDIWANL